MEFLEIEASFRQRESRNYAMYGVQGMVAVADTFDTGPFKIVCIGDAVTTELIYAESFPPATSDLECWKTSKFFHHFEGKTVASYKCRKSTGPPVRPTIVMVGEGFRTPNETNGPGPNQQFIGALGFVPLKGGIDSENAARMAAKWSSTFMLDHLKKEYGIIGAGWRSDDLRDQKETSDLSLSLIVLMEKKLRKIKFRKKDLEIHAAIEAATVTAQSTGIDMDDSAIHPCCFTNSEAVLRPKYSCDEFNFEPDMNYSEYYEIRTDRQQFIKAKTRLMLEAESDTEDEF